MNFLAIAWVCASPMIKSCELRVVQTPFPTHTTCEEKLAQLKPVLDERKKIYSFLLPYKARKDLIVV